MAMSELKRILFIDDDCEDYRDEFDSAFSDDVDIIYCPGKNDAIKEINSKKHFDLIILDWFLDKGSGSSELSQLILQSLYNKLFIPVLIWSNHIAEFESDLDSGLINYPKILIKDISKGEVSPETIKSKIKEWLESSLSVQISEIYRNSINENLEKAFFELAEVPNADIASILKVLVGSDENIDWSNDFILNLIHRKLLTDESFFGKFKTLVTSPSDNLRSEELTKRRNIINKVLYYRGTPKVIRCGDIIRIQKDEELLKYGIVVTPDCDIAQRNSRYLEIVELRKIEDDGLMLSSGQKETIREYKNASFYYFPSVDIDGNLENDFVAILKSKFIVEGWCENNSEKYPRIPEILNYSGNFRYNEDDVEINHICSKSNPYKSDFLQKLHTNNSRVGIPDIKDLLKP